MTSQSIEGHVFPDLEVIDAEDSVCFEEDHPKSVLPKKNQCGRAACSKIRQSSSRKTSGLYDLLAFSSYWCS